MMVVVVEWKGMMVVVVEWNDGGGGMEWNDGGGGGGME